MLQRNDKSSRPLVNRLVSASTQLTAPQKWTLVALLDHHNPKNGTKVWPGVPRLAEITHFCDKTVRRALHDLKSMGYISIDEQPGATSIYYLNVEMIEKAAGHSVHTGSNGMDRESRGSGQRVHTPRTESLGGLDRESTKQSKEQSKGTGNLTGSYTNRQNSHAKHISDVLHAAMHKGESND